MIIRCGLLKLPISCLDSLRFITRNTRTTTDLAKILFRFFFSSLSLFRNENCYRTRGVQISQKLIEWLRVSAVVRNASSFALNQYFPYRDLSIRWRAPKYGDLSKSPETPIWWALPAPQENYHTTPDGCAEAQMEEMKEKKSADYRNDDSNESLIKTWKYSEEEKLKISVND